MMPLPRAKWHDASGDDGEFEAERSEIGEEIGEGEEDIESDGFSPHSSHGCSSKAGKCAG